MTNFNIKENNKNKKSRKNSLNINKLIPSLTAIMLASAMLCACGSKSADRSAYSTKEMAVAETAAAAEIPMAMGGSYDMISSSNEEAAMDDYIDGEFGGVLSEAELSNEAAAGKGAINEAPANPDAKTPGPANPGGEIPNTESQDLANPDTAQKTTPRKLIKNVYLEIETKEYDKLASEVLARINAFGGYIEASNEYHPGINDQYSKRNINITARIPSDRLNEFVNGVEQDGNVTYKSENVTDVTLNYTDTESRKKSLEVERDRLMELMKEAESVDAIIAIESRLSEIRYEIESRESQLRVYDNQVDYSTVNMFINEVAVLSPQSEASLSQRLIDGMKQNLRDIGRFFENAFVGIVTHIPAILLVAAAIAIIIVIIKKIGKGLSEKKATKKSKNEPAVTKEEETK